MRVSLCLALVGVGAVAAASLVAHDARACSCVGPRMAMLTPVRAQAAPLNTRVRIEAPSSTARATFVLRAHRGAVVPTAVTVISSSSLDVVELTPNTPLARETRYEVAVVDPSAVPSTTVVGTFTTGTTTDTVAPKVKSYGTAKTRMNLGHVGGGMCSIRGPWIELEGLAVEDPGRPDAELAYAIWGPDGTGKLDTKGPPTAIYRPHDGRLFIGRTSLCDPRDFPLSGPRTTLAVAAVDEAGNRGPERRFTLDLTRPTP